MNKELIKQIQIALLEAGFDPKGADGVIGPNTEKAIVAYKKSQGLAARPYLGPITLARLLGGEPEDMPPVDINLPWMNELSKYMGFHEITNNAALKKWLKSDGATLGDPSKLPWCGDAMETAIRLALPDEWANTHKTLKANPYWADNWRLFGQPSKEGYGALATFSRPGGNHIAMLVGKDSKRGRYRVRGGNQSNSINDTWIDIKRLTSIRRPSTWNAALPKLPEMNSAGQIVSTNEA